jgi:ribosomal-protein-alanine N-acetyltransferase
MTTSHISPRREPILEGPRVTLRLGAAEDVPSIVTFYRDNRDHFRPTDPPRPPSFYTEAFWAERVTTSALEFHEDRSCHLFVHERRSARAVIGYANLSNFVRGAFHACYLGYGIGAAHQGQGLMAEAIGLAIDLAFRELRLHRIMANHLPTNERSARLLRRLGFVKEGYAQRYLYIDGAWRDHVLTALTNDRWEPPVGRAG